MDEVRTLGKRTILVTLCLLMVLSPFYAGSSIMKANAQFKLNYGGTMIIAYGADPISFNPITQWESTSMYLMQNTYAKAYRYDDLYNVVGYACKGSPEYASTAEYPSIWTFNLKDNVLWHDGTPMTSKDLEFTYGMHAWGAQNNPDHMEWHDYLEIPMYHSTTYFADLAKIETPDDLTMVMYFDKVNLGDFITEMNMNVILPEHLWGDFNKNNPTGRMMENNQYGNDPIGAGPYKVVQYEKDQYIVMDRFEDYFDGRPYLDHLVWVFIESDTAAILALENGEIGNVHQQLLLNFPLSEIVRVNSNPKLTVGVFPFTTTWRVTVNMHPDALARWPWLGDRDVRYAMEYAIDKQAIIDNILFGSTRKVDTVISWLVAPYGGDYNTVNQGYTSDWAITPRDYDPAKAAELLDGAGWTLNADGIREKNGVIIGGVAMPYYDYATSWAEVISAYWTDVGIFINPLPIEAFSFFVGIETSEFGLEAPAFGGGPYPLGLNAMDGGPNPDGVNEWIQSRGSFAACAWDTGIDNLGFYSNPRVDDLFDIGGNTANYTARKAAYDEMQYLVHQDAGFLMLWNKWLVEAWNNDFTGFGSNRPVAWWGSYFRGTDESTNAEKGVYWRGGKVVNGGDAPTIVDTITDVTTTPDSTTIPEFMNLRVLAVVSIILVSGTFLYQRRRRDE